MAEWSKIRHRCPGARLVCIDIAPHGTVQAHEGDDILNVGGFSDTVFDVVGRFLSGTTARHWVDEINAVNL